jgi:hypothetical protein
MKVARLALFFSIMFVLLFIIAALIRYFQLRIDAVRLMPLQPETMLPEFIAAARWALSLTLYLAILLGLSYSVREHIVAFPALVCLIILAGGLYLGLMVGLERTGVIPAARDIGKPLGKPGLILTQPGAAIVLVKDPAEVRGPRVVAVPGQPLIYQALPQGPNNTILALPPIPFNNKTPWFLQSIAIDLSLSARQAEDRLKEGLIPFLVYALSLIFFLTSPRFAFNVSTWPLANLFSGCLVFRGILALETFVNSSAVQDIFASFLGNRFPLSYTTPFIFCTFGTLINLYTFLVYLAKRRSDEED